MPDAKLQTFELSRWAAIERGVRDDAVRLAQLVLDGKGNGREAEQIARRIDSVRRDGLAAEY